MKNFGRGHSKEESEEVSAGSQWPLVSPAGDPPPVLFAAWAPQLMTAKDILSEYYCKQFPALRNVFFRDIVRKPIVLAEARGSCASSFVTYAHKSRNSLISFDDAESYIEYYFHCVWVQHCEFNGAKTSAGDKGGDVEISGFEDAVNAIGEALSSVICVRCRYLTLREEREHDAGV